MCRQKKPSLLFGRRRHQQKSNRSETAKNDLSCTGAAGHAKIERSEIFATNTITKGSDVGSRRLSTSEAYPVPCNRASPTPHVPRQAPTHRLRQRNPPDARRVQRHQRRLGSKSRSRRALPEWRRPHQRNLGNAGHRNCHIDRVRSAGILYNCRLPSTGAERRRYGLRGHVESGENRCGNGTGRLGWNSH